MVLEQLFKIKWLERKYHSFFIGFIYATLGIFCAMLIAPSYAGVISIAFASILLVPSLNQLLMVEENIEIREKKFSLYLLFKDHFDIIKVYFFLFLGIFAAYFICAFIIRPEFSTKLFETQLYLTNVIGHAAKSERFLMLLINNLIVFAVCVSLSLIYGAGSILFLTINASAWGTFFGYTLKQVVSTTSNGKIAAFLSFILPVLPHTITEALGYIFATIVGGVISKAVLREKPFSKKFNHIMTDSCMLIVIGLMLVTIAGLIEVYVLT